MALEGQWPWGGQTRERVGKGWTDTVIRWGRGGQTR